MLRRFARLTFVAALLVGSPPSQASVANLCHRLLDEVLLLAGAETFPAEPVPGRVTNQCNAGSCWVHAGVGVIENQLRRQGLDIPLSHDFILYHHVRDQLLAEVDRMINDDAVLGLEFSPSKSFEFGGAFNESLMRVIDRHGAIPKSAWKGKDLGTISPENYAAMHAELYQSLKSFNKHIKRKVWSTDPQGRMRHKYQWSPNHAKAMEAVRRDMYAEIDQILKQNGWDKPDEGFSYDGQNYSPKSFADQVMKHSSKNYTIVRVDPIQSLLDRGRKGVSPDDALAQIQQLLASGKPIWAAFRWLAKHVDTSTGSIGKRWYESYMNVDSDGYHAVQIVGIDTGPTGTLAGIRIRNSWGEGSGDGGYFVMTPHYFRTYLQEFGFSNQ